MVLCIINNTVEYIGLLSEPVMHWFIELVVWHSNILIYNINSNFVM